MAHPLPILRNTTGGLNAQVLFPFTRTLSFMTEIIKSQNAQEQRWPLRPPLSTFEIPMSSLLTGDKLAWLNFLNSVKGQASQDLTVTLGSTTYSNLTLLQDGLSFQVQHALQYDQVVRLRQVSNGSWSPSSAQTTYPTLKYGKATGGAVAEMPFTQVSTYLTSVNDSPYGPRFAYSWYGSSLTNFPTGYLRNWVISYPLLNSTDEGTLETFFNSVQGRSNTFSLVDPVDGQTYNNVRFDMDDLVIRYLVAGHFSTEVTLTQTFIP